MSHADGNILLWTACRRGWQPGAPSTAGRSKPPCHRYKCHPRSKQLEGDNLFCTYLLDFHRAHSTHSLQHAFSSGLSSHTPQYSVSLWSPSLSLPVVPTYPGQVAVLDVRLSEAHSAWHREKKNSIAQLHMQPGYVITNTCYRIHYLLMSPYNFNSATWVTHLVIVV